VRKRTRPPGKSLTGSRSERRSMITAIVIPVDTGQPIRQQQLHSSDLDAYRQIVGGNIEVLDLNHPFASMYFNEEGKLNRLRVNHRATTIMWVHNSVFRGHDVIVGPAFLVGPPDRDGHDMTVPDDLVDLLFHTKRYRVQFQTRESREWSGDNQAFIDWFEAYTYGVQLAKSWMQIKEIRVVPELDAELRAAWFKLGQANPWIKTADDPPFTRDSFVGCYSIEELADRIGHGNWSLGTAFYYRELCFINQIDGGDEWLTIRHGIAFESMTLEPSIEDGTFVSLVRRLLTASKEQCLRLEY
jgi:Domain of unknown function (DUF3846)